jgi:hypothetical protein
VVPPPDIRDTAPEPVSPADGRDRRTAQHTTHAHNEPLKRSRWFSDWADRLLFLVFFVAGFAAILAIKLSGGSTLLAALAAAALLLSYAALAGLLPYFRLQSDRLGDNCYYLGLLYTLASLAAALMQIESAAQAQRGALIETLLASFGVALSSTILGIALRVFFLQMRQEFDDLEEQLRQDLNKRALDLKDQMLFAVTELESFRLRTQQVLEERLAQATDKYAEHAARQTVEVGRIATQMQDRIEQTFRRHQANAEALAHTTEELVASGAALVARVQGIDVPRDLLTKQADLISQRLARGADRMTAAADRFAERLATIDVPSDMIASRLAPLAVAIGDVTSRLSTTMEAEQRRAAALQNASEGVVSSQVELRAATSNLVASVAMVERLSSGLIALQQSVPAATQAVDQLRAALEAEAETVRRLASASADEARQVRAHRDQLLADLAGSREALGRTQETLTEIVRVITDRLGG